MASRHSSRHWTRTAAVASPQQLFRLMGGEERHLSRVAQLRGVGIVVFAGQAGPATCDGSPMVGVPEDAIGIENRKGHCLRE
jgi:hypothetical protein